MDYSPTLGVVTAIAEILAVIWILCRNGTRGIFGWMALLLGLLAGYQILEVMICWRGQPTSQGLSRLAFLDITWLPPVGLILVKNLVGTASEGLKKYVRGIVGVAAVMSFWILVDYRFITGTICQFMYAKYTYVEPYFHLYGAFYEISQMSLIFLPLYLMVQAPDQRVRQNLFDMACGTLLFVLPSLMIAATVPEVSGHALPSVMCHFAIFLAIFLVRIARRETIARSGTLLSYSNQC